jgi:hypothetical protein
MFQARTDATAEVEYAAGAALGDAGPQQIVHEVKGLFAAADALTPNRSVNGALRTALATGEKVRGVLVIIARHVGALEPH